MNEVTPISTESIETVGRYWGVSKKDASTLIRRSIAEKIRARTNDGDTILDTLTAIMDDPDQEARDRLRAAETLLDRAYGKPIAPTIDLNQAAAQIAERYGLDPAELASIAQSVWSAQSTPQHIQLEAPPEDPTQLSTP